MTLAHACKHEKAEVMPYLQRCREILGMRKPADPLKAQWQGLNRRERIFWIRAAGANRLLSLGSEHSPCPYDLSDMTEGEWEAVRGVILKSAARASQIVGGQ
jgi:hypothetical protein